MFLLKIGFFKIGLSQIFSLIFGIAIGIAIVTLIYLLFVLKTMNSKQYKEKTEVKIITDLECEKLDKKMKRKLDDANLQIVNEKKTSELVLSYQEMFSDKILKGNMSDITYAKELSKNLVINIAKIYFPDSKKPLFEISTQELLKLGAYISTRVDEILNYNGLKFLRKIKIITFINVGKVKKTIEDLDIIKFSKKYNINAIVKGIKSVINIVNPFYWVRKIIVNTSMKIIIRKLCVIVIGIVGEETYKVYSKSVFTEKLNLIEGGPLYED